MAHLAGPIRPSPVLVPATLAIIAVAYAAFVGWCAWRTARSAPNVRVAAVSGDGLTGSPDRIALSTGLPDPLPRVAVLVAARDEEATIGRCLDALLAQDYPAELMEIVVADDHSTDRTAAVVRRYIAQPHVLSLAGVGAEEMEEEPLAHPVVHYVRVPAPSGELCGKAHAIHTATEQTDAPVLLVTDADCEVPTGWVRGLVASLGDGVGMTGGLTQMVPGTAFDAAQSLDWAFLLGVASALTEAGQPATVMGNNIAFRREAYDDVGGYPALPFSVTEDYALFKAISESGLWRTRFPIRPETLVRTLPAPSFAQAYRQRRRWARGGMRAGRVLWAAYALAHLAHLVPLLGLLLAPAAGAAALAVKLGADALHLAAVRRRGGAGPLRLGPFLRFEVFLFAYMTTLPLTLLLAPRIRWKGRTH